MQYISTRGESEPIDFEATIFQGYAPDGGLYVPNSIPNVDWGAWRTLSYKEISVKLLEIFDGNKDTPFKDLVDKALSLGFQVPGCVKVRTLDRKLKILELFHGPTWAFKDYALKIIGELQQFYLQRNKSHQIALVATSGDTGSAAIEAVRGKSRIEILVLYPYNRISAIQEKQLRACSDKNVHVFCVDGNSDELDDVLLPLYNDVEFSSKYHITSFNSIQWSRVLIQMAHWIYGYFQATNSNEERLLVAVPCGACGNLASGMYAKRLGLPIDIVACSGKNDSVVRCITTGTLSTATVSPSLATAMDIQVPYNMERIFSLLSQGNTALMKSLMDTYNKTGSVTLPKELSDKLKQKIQCHLADDEDIKTTVRWSYDNYKYFVCPHTATAVSFARKNATETVILCIATASYEKFPQVIAQSVMDSPPITERQNKLKATTPCSIQFLARESQSEWTGSVSNVIKEISAKMFPG